MRYRITRKIGHGGMGEVYEGRRPVAEDQEWPVAIKLMRPQYVANSDMVRAFEREALTSMRVNHEHPNLITVYDYSVASDGRPYLVMDMIEGANLHDIAIAGRIPYDHIRRIAIDVLEALGYLHNKRLYHRDVSPRNVLVSSAGVVKLADLGLARSADSIHSNEFRGTAPYASWEALQGMQLDERADLYSLGAVLYELIMIQPPYGYGDALTIHNRMRNDTPPPLPDDIPGDLQVLIYGTIAPLRENRAFLQAGEALAMLDEFAEPFASDADMSALVVERVATSPRVEESPPLTVVQPGTPKRRLSPWKLTPLLAVAAVALLAGGMLIARYQTSPAEVIQASGPIAEVTAPAQPRPAPVAEVCPQPASQPKPGTLTTPEPSPATVRTKPKRRTRPRHTSPVTAPPVPPPKDLELPKTASPAPDLPPDITLLPREIIP